MKFFKILYTILLIFSIVTCKQETTKNNQKPLETKKKQETFYQKAKLIKIEALDSLMKKEKNLQKLIRNLQDSIYTLELLKDRIPQNISYIHPLTFIKTHTVLDTAAIRSRFVLTEVHLRKINYLINKPKVDKDSIEKTLDQVITDINNIVKHIELYQNTNDEFKDILNYDSIKHDTENIGNSIINSKKIPKRILKNIKNIKLPKNIKHEKNY